MVNCKNKQTKKRTQIMYYIKRETIINGKSQGVATGHSQPI